MDRTILERHGQGVAVVELYNFNFFIFFFHVFNVQQLQSKWSRYHSVLYGSSWKLKSSIECTDKTKPNRNKYRTWSDVLLCILPFEIYLQNDCESASFRSWLLKVGIKAVAFSRSERMTVPKWNELRDEENKKRNWTKQMVKLRATLEMVSICYRIVAGMSMLTANATHDLLSTQWIALIAPLMYLSTGFSEQKPFH